MSATFVIAFGPNQSYYFSNGRQTLWSNVPQKLGLLLTTDARFRPEKVVWVNLGPNAAYYIRSKEAVAYDNISPAVQSKIESIGGWKALAWIMFTPDPTTYLILTTEGDLFGKGLTQAFYDAVVRNAFHGFKDICIGYNGAFALSTNNDKVSYLGMPKQFFPAWQSGQVEQVTTSTFDPFYFIEFKDGRTVFLCPESWHPTLNALTRSAPKTSSGAMSSGQSSSGASFASAAPPLYQSQQQPAGNSIVTGFISETANDLASTLAVQMMQAWLQQ